MASLADLNVRLGADVSPLARGLNQAKGSIASFTGSIQTANTVLKRTNNTILEVDSAIEGLEQAYVNARTAQARFAIGAKMTQLRTLRADMTKTTGAVSAMGGGFGGANMAVVNFNRVIQDAPFGILGVANNIEPLLLSFQGLKAQAGSTTGAIRTLITKALTGPGALITAFSVVSSLAIVFSRRNRGVGDSAEDTTKKLEKQREALNNLEKAYLSFSEETLEDQYTREARNIDKVLELMNRQEELQGNIISQTKNLRVSIDGTIDMQDAHNKKIADTVDGYKSEIATISDLINGYGFQGKSVEDLTNRKKELTDQIGYLNNAQTDEAQLGRFIEEQQVRTAKALEMFNAGVQGGATAVRNQRAELQGLINSFRLLANQGQSNLIPVINALQDELDSLSNKVTEVTPGIALNLGENIILDLDLDALSADLEKFIEGFEAPSFIMPIESGSIVDLTAKMRELQMIQSVISDPEQYQLLQVAINAIGGEIDLLKGSTDNLNSGFDILDSLATRFTDSFGQGMANVVVQGEKLEDILDNIGRLLLSSAIQTGIKILLTGGMKGGGFFGKDGGLLGNLFKELGFSGSVAPAVPTASMPSPSIVPVLSTVSNAENTAQSFERALENYTARLGPNEFFALSQKGRLGY